MNVINSENLKSFLKTPPEKITGKTVLPGEIDGLKTRLYCVPPGQSVTLDPQSGQGLAYLFTAGQGTIQAGRDKWDVNEIAFFAPVHGQPFSMTSKKIALEVLELAVSLNTADLKEFKANRKRYPYFVSYSDCKTYREKIKSPKTVNRTLMPEHTFPRLCAGSVQTRGDDHVAAHKHPMLEQLFFGLKGSRTVVHADGRSTAFNENELLHIPPGSNHSVDVKAPDKLHYIWIDLFRDKKGMDWITRQHQ